MIFTKGTKIETGFLAVLSKLIYALACCLFSMHVSGQYIRDSIYRESEDSFIVVTKGAAIVYLTDSEGYIVYHQNKKYGISKPFVYIAKGATIFTLPESEGYDIINQNVKTESNDVSLKQSSVKKTKQTTSEVSQKVIGKNTRITITYKTIPSKDQYEKHLKFRTNTIVPTCHHHDGKNAILNSAFRTFGFAYSEKKIIETLVARSRLGDFESFFARPPPQ